MRDTIADDSDIVEDILLNAAAIFFFDDDDEDALDELGENIARRKR